MVEGVELGTADGAVVGSLVGVAEGAELGIGDGAVVGVIVNEVEGSEVGIADGAVVGSFVGGAEGMVVGAMEGVPSAKYVIRNLCSILKPFPVHAVLKSSASPLMENEDAQSGSSTDDPSSDPTMKVTVSCGPGPKQANAAPAPRHFIVALMS